MFSTFDALVDKHQLNVTQVLNNDKGSFNLAQKKKKEIFEVKGKKPDGATINAEHPLSCDNIQAD